MLVAKDGRYHVRPGDLVTAMPHHINARFCVGIVKSSGLTTSGVRLWDVELRSCVTSGATLVQRYQETNLFKLVPLRLLRRKRGIELRPGTRVEIDANLVGDDYAGRGVIEETYEAIAYSGRTYPMYHVRRPKGLFLYEHEEVIPLVSEVLAREHRK